MLSDAMPKAILSVGLELSSMYASSIGDVSSVPLVLLWLGLSSEMNCSLVPHTS